MRNHPFAVGGVAAKTSAQVVVDTTPCHLSQRHHDHVEGFFVVATTTPCKSPLSQQAFNSIWHGELWRVAETTILAVVLLR